MSAQAPTFSIFSVQDHYPALARTQAQFLTQLLDEVALAEDLGFDTFWVAEHHFHEYGMIPNPAVFLAAAAQRSRRIRLGVAVSVLPLRDPLQVAEDYALVDLLSGGRLTLGVGSGYLKHEFEGFGLTLDDKRGRFEESLAVIEAAFSGEPVHFYGRYHRIAGTRINVVPLQRPRPPMLVAVLRKEAAYHVGRAGRMLMSMPYATVDSLAEVGEIVAAYQSGWADGGFPAPAPDIAFGFHCYVAADDRQARADAEGAFDAYVRSRLYGKSAGWDEITERGYCLFGGVETVAARVTEMQALGIRHLLLLCNFGALAPERVAAGMRMMASEVMPRFARGGG